MSFKVVMPKLSDAMQEGRILQWLKREGDRVEGGDPIASIETDKAEIEMEAFGSGVLRKIVVPAGQSAPVGSLIGVIADPEEDICAIVAGGPAPARAAAPAPAPPASSPAAAPPSPPASDEGWLRASPVARRLAREAGIDLSAIRGSGPQGRILERDVEAFVAARPAAPPAVAAATPPAAPQVVAAGKDDFEERDLSAMRRAIAARMVQSKAPVPHFYLTTEVDMGQAAEFREAVNAFEGGGKKISFTDLIVKGCALALGRHRLVNAAYVDGKIRLYRRVDVGIAVALEDGLITPVVRRCDQKTLRQIGQEAAELAERARGRKLTPQEYTGATFTVSNLGMFDIVEFSAIINPPEAAILAVGAILQKPVVVEGAVAVRRRMRLTLSGDHRVIDGATGARFLQDVKTMLEKPYLLVV
ncbi:MAG TPA: dihydrolipoamide acetyltransferase family protein [Candidatus Sulfotelmatobacter sp.]|nr:dihydrolipoamide acetyltransferase family protein [Candidatus Sulfotelmatobacter sp.]